MVHMLDTNIASYIIKGGSIELENKLISIAPSSLCLSVMSQVELLYSLKNLPAKHHLHFAVQRFLEIIRVLPWDQEAADYYTDIRYQVSCSGKKIGQLDMMIAAHALSAGAVLTTISSSNYEEIDAPLMLAYWN